MITWRTSAEPGGLVSFHLFFSLASFRCTQHTRCGSTERRQRPQPFVRRAATVAITAVDPVEGVVDWWG